MKYLKIKDSRLRKLFCKYEKFKFVVKFVFINLLNKGVKDSFGVFRSSVLRSIINKKYIHKTRISRRCILNNRSKIPLQNFGISRIYLRELMQCGMIPGCSKSIW
jgi:ribosomal protein S14